DTAAGTGVSIPPEDVYAFAEAVEDIARLTQFIDTRYHSELNGLRSWWGREVAKARTNIRANAVNWIERRFRENNLAELLKSCYEKARLYAYYRAVTS
ncbi:MAG: hypothetical protein JHC33_07500, partial [Ignisphaera sp.]|nr:hypothetical protein [Ignisphaera sp.]